MSEAAGGAGRAGKARSSTAAFFDVDGTLVSTHIVHQYIHVRRYLARQYGGMVKRLTFPVWLTGFYLKCLQYLRLDRLSRTRMNIAFYHNYAGLACDRVREAAEDCFNRVLQPHLYGEALACIDEHVRAGRRVILVTGSVDFLIQPLVGHIARTLDTPAPPDLIARTLTVRDGRFTGELDGPPIGEGEKAEQVRRFADRQEIDLESSFAYGDSKADLPMFEAVGYPHVVNPDRTLADVARRHGWPTHRWHLSRNGR